MSSIFVTNIHYDTHVGFSELMEGFRCGVLLHQPDRAPQLRVEGENTRGKDPSAGQRVAVMVTPTSPHWDRQVFDRYLI